MRWSMFFVVLMAPIMGIPSLLLADWELAAFYVNRFHKEHTTEDRCCATCGDIDWGDNLAGYLYATVGLWGWDSRTLYADRVTEWYDFADSSYSNPDCGSGRDHLSRLWRRFRRCGVPIDSRVFGWQPHSSSHGQGLGRCSQSRVRTLH